MVWLRLVEVWLTTRLLQSPTFHRAVRTVHKKVHELQHGKDPSEMGGTKIDKIEEGRDAKKFIQFYVEELKGQLRGGPPPKK